jgi:hypothetical protein
MKSVTAKWQKKKLIEGGSATLSKFFVFCFCHWNEVRHCQMAKKKKLRGGRTTPCLAKGVGLTTLVFFFFVYIYFIFCF